MCEKQCFKPVLKGFLLEVVCRVFVTTLYALLSSLNLQFLVPSVNLRGMFRMLVEWPAIHHCWCIGQSCFQKTKSQQKSQLSFQKYSPEINLIEEINLISRPFAFLAVRHMSICGKIVDYISGHKQFDVASAFSNLKKKNLSKSISPFGTVKTESENIWIC